MITIPDPNSPTTPAESAPSIPAAPSGSPTTVSGPPGTALQIAQLLAANTIDATQAGKLARAGNLSMMHVAQALSTLREAAEPQVDVRSDAEKEVDREFGSAAKQEEYLIQMYTPGQAPPVIPKEVQAFEANARGWMADAGLPLNLGNSLVNTLSKAIQRTRAMTPEQRESFKDAENAKLEQLFGPDWHETKLKPVAVMIQELDRSRRGLKELVRAHGDNAMFVAQLIHAARIYHARKGAR